MMMAPRLGLGILSVMALACVSSLLPRNPLLAVQFAERMVSACADIIDATLKRYMLGFDAVLTRRRETCDNKCESEAHCPCG